MSEKQLFSLLFDSILTQEYNTVYNEQGIKQSSVSVIFRINPERINDVDRMY